MEDQASLSAGGLLKLLRTGFEGIEDHRVAELVKVSLTDTLMSAFAMFSLKDPSLLAFDKRRRADGNPAIPATCNFPPCIQSRMGLRSHVETKCGRKSAQDLEFRSPRLPK